jgi:peptide/nickel transport system substrate-binding protein
MLRPTMPRAFIIAADGSMKVNNDYFTNVELTSTDPQVVTYTINPKAVWSDGTPITWEDIASQINATSGKDKNFAIAAPNGSDRVASVTRGVDDRQAVITFAKHYSEWRGMFSGNTMLLPKSMTANPEVFNKGQLNGPGPSAGPFLISAVDRTAQRIVLTRNPKWWGTPAKLDKLVDAYVGSDSDTNVKALQNQEVNMVYPQPQLDLIASLQQLSGVTTEVNFGIAFEHLDFNIKDPLLAHKEVRQAIAYGIDRKALVNATVGKFSDKASVLNNRLLMTNQKGYEDHGGDYTSQNVQKAQQLLESIGAKKGSDGYYSLNGKPLAFKIMTTQNNPLRDQTIQTIASQLKEVGIKISEFANPDIFADTDKPTSLVSEGFQIALFAWVGGPSISANKSIYLSPAGGGVGQNYTQGGTPEIDAALNAMGSATNTDDEIAAANKADSLLWDQMYTLPLYQKPTLLAFDSNFTGIGDNATQAGPLWNSDTFAKKS